MKAIKNSRYRQGIALVEHDDGLQERLPYVLRIEHHNRGRFKTWLWLGEDYRLIDFSIISNSPWTNITDNMACQLLDHIIGRHDMILLEYDMTKGLYGLRLSYDA